MDGEAARHLEPAQQNCRYNARDIGVIALFEQAANQNHRNREHRDGIQGVCIGIGRAENQRLHTVLSIQIEAHKGDNQRGQHIHHSKEQVINPLRLLANLAMVGAVQCDGNSHTKHQIEGQVLKEGQEIGPWDVFQTPQIIMIVHLEQPVCHEGDDEHYRSSRRYRPGAWDGFRSPDSGGG